jgi:TonB-linked SusC/RagA family outer membrane protein
MKKKLLSIFLVCMMFAAAALAQDKRINGKVTAQDDGLPLPGVSVKVTGTTIGTQTDANGNYSLNVPSIGKSLEFSFIGFLSQSASVAGKAQINVSLITDSKQLSEVIVSGYGTLTKREAGGAIAKVEGKEFFNQGIKSVDQALQGRASGVVVQSNNGIPGGGISVQIRGIASFTAGSQPLYIVDGVQLNLEGSSNITQANPLAGINPNDIASIEVLKDGASASIYGAQAANGVVLVTTKKGKAGKTKFLGNAYTGSVDYIKLFNVTNTQDFIKFRSEAVRNANPSFSEAAVRGNVLGGIFLDPNLTDAQIAELPNTDWQKEATQTGIIQNFELSASGGNEKTTFYLAGSYNNSNTFISKVNFKRGVFRANLQHQASDKLTFDTRLNLSSFSQNSPFAVDGSNFGNPAYAASQILQINPVRNPDGTYFGLPGSGQNFAGNLNQNIVAINEFNSGQANTNQVLASLSAVYKFNKIFTFKSFASLDYRTVQDYQYRDPRTNDGFNNQGSGFNSFEDRINFLTNQTLSFIVPNLKNQTLSGFIGAEYRSDLNEGFNASATGFPSPEFRNLNSAANPTATGGFFTGFKRAGVFSSIRYNYKGKYNLTSNIRYDGSSKFGINNQYGLFGGVSAAWTITEEKFLKSVTWLDELKFRASYGVVGNDDIGNFSSRGLYGGAGVYGNQAGITPSGLANPSLQWEKSTTYDTGLEFSIFKEALSGEIGVYRRVSTDLLLNQPLLSTTGFGSITTNAGSIRINGLEIDLNSINLKTKGGFEWTSNFNFSFFRSKILKLYNDLEILPSDPSVRVGWERGVVYNIEYAGANPATGRPMFFDANNNLTYTPLPADRKVVGNTIPNMTGGFTNEIKYKGFDFSALLQYQYGRSQFDGQLQFLYRLGVANHNSSKDIFDRRWTTPGQLTDVPRPFNGGIEPQGVANNSTSTRFLFKTDLIRLKTIQLGYTIPEKIISKIKISSFRVYAQGQNLFTYDDYPGYDPEFFGSATGIIPQSKNLTVGLLVGF